MRALSRTVSDLSLSIVVLISVGCSREANQVNAISSGYASKLSGQQCAGIGGVAQFHGAGQA